MRFVKNLYLLYEERKWSSVILFITCFSLAHIDSSHAREEMENYQIGKHNSILTNYQRALVVESKCHLTAFDADDIEKTDLIQLYIMPVESCTFDLYSKSNIFYNHYTGSIMSIPPLKSELQTFANLNNPKQFYNVYDLAVDFINKKVYIMTVNNKQESDKLMVVDMVSGQTGIVLTDLDLPNRIEVDPFEGILFIQQQTTILRANMDGTSRVKVIERDGISNLAIDRKSRSIFWATSLDIESSGYYTTSVRLVASIGRPIRSLAVLGDEIFWISTPYGLMQPNTTVFGCTMSASSPCDVTSLRTIPHDDPYTIKAYDFNVLQSQISMKDNPCDHVKPRCQHLCLLKKNGYSCACEVGYRLNSDRRTCQLAYDEFLLYVQGNYAKGRIIGSETNDSMNFVDAIYPNGLVSEGKFVSFDYDYESNSIFFTDNASDKNKLYKKKLHTDYEQTTAYIYDRKVHSTAFDWVSKNIYQFISDGSPQYNSTIMVHHYSTIQNFGKKKQLIYSTQLLKLPTNWETGDIVVHPLRGSMFITVRSDTFENGRIYEANLDGSNLTNCLTDVSLWGLAIDFQEDKLYLLDSKRTSLIFYNYHHDIRLGRFDISVVKNATSLSVSSHYIYVGNLTTVWRFDKKTGQNPLKVIESANMRQPKTIIGTMIYGVSAQPIPPEHPCVIKNGGCEKFCFGVPRGREKFRSKKIELRRQCGCEKDEKLGLDGISCGTILPQQNYLEH